MYKTKIGDLHDFFFKATSELRYVVRLNSEKEAKWWRSAKMHSGFCVEGKVATVQGMKA